MRGGAFDVVNGGCDCAGGIDVTLPEEATGPTMWSIMSSSPLLLLMTTTMTKKTTTMKKKTTTIWRCGDNASRVVRDLSAAWHALTRIGAACG